MKHLKRICFVVGVACFAPFGFGQDDTEILINLDFEDDTVGEQPEIIIADITPSPNEGTPAEEGRGFVVIDGASEPPNPLSGKSLYIYDLSEEGGVWLFLPFAGGVNRSEVRFSFDFQRAFAVEEGSDTRFPSRIYVVLGRVEDRLNRGNLQPFSLSLFNNGTLAINAPRGGWPRRFNYITDTGSVNKVDILANSHDTDPVEYDLEDLGAGTVKPNSFHFFLNGDKMGEYDFHVAPDPNDPPEPRFNEQDDDLGKLLFFQGGRGKGGIVFDNISLTAIPAPRRPAGETLPLNFIIQPGSESEIRIASSTGGQASDTVVYEGNLLADIDFDAASRRVNSITFQGGEMTVSDVDLSFTSNVNSADLGTFSTEFRVETNQIKQYLITPNSPGMVDPDSLQLINSDHLTRIDDGSISLTITALGQSQTMSVDYRTNSEDVQGSGTGTLFVREYVRRLQAQTLQFVLESRVDESESIPLQGTNAMIEISERGVVRATATVDIPADMPSNFLNWATSNGVTIITGAERNHFNVPYALAFAFGLPPNSSSRDIPIFLRSNPPGLELNFPEDGLGLSLIALYSETLSSESWIPLPNEYITHGLDSLDKGSVGTTSVIFPSPYPSFIRFELAP